MTRLTTEHAELFLDASLVLFFSQFAILSEMGRGIGGGRLRSAVGAGRTLVPVVRALALVVLLLGLALGVGGAGRALGVGCRRRRRVLGLAQDLGLVFPVPGIDGLCESVEAIEGVGLSDVGDLLLDVQIIHKGALLCPVSETKIRGMLQNTDLVPSVRD